MTTPQLIYSKDKRLMLERQGGVFGGSSALMVAAKMGVALEYYDRFASRWNNKITYSSGLFVCRFTKNVFYRIKKG
jgi:hypothetical protein